MVNSTQKRFRGWRSLACLVIIPQIFAITFAAGTSKAMWNYCFFRPGVDSRVRSANKIISAAKIKTIETPSGIIFEGEGAQFDPAYLMNPSKNGYYVLSQRTAQSFIKKGKKLSNLPITDEEIYRSFYEWLLDNKKLIKGKKERISNRKHIDYSDQAKHLSGDVYTLAGSSSQNFVLFCLRSGQVENDHYAYYEFLFELEKNQKLGALLSETMFFFDVAGFEGIEFPAFWVFWSIVFHLISSPGLLIWAALRGAPKA